MAGAMPRSPFVTTLALVALALAPAVPAGETTLALPDLRAIIDSDILPTTVHYDQDVPPDDVAEGCAGATSGRTLVRFTLSSINEGDADVVLGDPGCPDDCAANPGPTCTNEFFECSPVDGHGHAHFSQYALYEVVPAADAPPAAAGHKQGFCIMDTLCDQMVYDCDFQGLSVGCKDSYFNFLGCQYVDVTNLPGGRYLLRATVNYARILEESNFENNVAEEPFEICDALTAPRLRLRTEEMAPGGLPAAARSWTASGIITYARPPLVAADPARDGAIVRLRTDDETHLDVVVPGGDGGCGQRDGWKRLRRDGGWRYRNTSGFLDAACTVPAEGLQRIKIRRRANGVRYAIRGRALALGEAPVELTLVLGSVTGPCGSGLLNRCKPRKRGKTIRCDASPSGAFLDAADGSVF
jgi:hypothetical protein